MTNLLLILGIIFLAVFVIFHISHFTFITFLFIVLTCLLVLKNISFGKRLAILEKKLNELLEKKASVSEQKLAKPAKPNLVETNVISETQTDTTSEYAFEQESEIKKEIPITKKAAEVKPVITTEARQTSAINTWIKSFLLTGNIIAKIGVLILFIGVAFLLKFVAIHVGLPIEYRLAGIFLAGVAMIAIGWCLSKKRKAYATILQGGGVGLMYLTIYAAFQLYYLLPPLVAFPALVVIALLSGMIAILQDAKWLAIFGILGGFLAPLLINTGSANHVLLFSYYLFLNVAILGIAWFKSWRELNLIGFLFTFIISALWGWQSYQSQYFYSTETFLAIFFLFYVALALLFAINKMAGKAGIVDTVITFGTPIIVYSLQIGLVRDITHGLAWSAVALCVFYAGLALIISTINSPSFRNLCRAFAAISILFATIAIPQFFSKIQTASAWALESIAMLWFGIRQKQLFIRIWGAIILLASSIVFILNASDVENARFVSELYLSGIFVAIANFIGSFIFCNRIEKKSEFELFFAIIFFLLGCIGWYFININQIYNFISEDNQFTVMMLFVANTSLVAWLLSEYLDWNWLRLPAVALLPAMMILNLLIKLDIYQVHAPILAWLYGFIVLYIILYRHDKFSEPYLDLLHVLSFLYLTWFIADQASTLIKHNALLPVTWQYIVWGVVPTAMLYLLCYGKTLLTWPLAHRENLYRNVCGILLVVFLIGWLIATNGLRGDLYPLRYFPLLNPLDLTIGLTLIGFVCWYRQVCTWIDKAFEFSSFKLALGLFLFLVFVWLNVIIFRTLSHWMYIPFTFDALWNSMLVQACLSIFWTSLALIETFIASRYGFRELWFFGFALILVVILKLFLVDLSGTNTLERIVTFIGVGILLLINGYISPLPPKSKNDGS